MCFFGKGCITQPTLVLCFMLMDYLTILFAYLLFQAPWSIAGSRPSPKWPERGIVNFHNYSTRYRPGMDLVLKDVSFQTNSAEKVTFYK